MREGLKMALTLLTIGALSGFLLTYFNNFTQPLIEAREKSDFMQAVEEYFPEVDNIEEKDEEEEGEEYLVNYDADGNLLGVIARAEADGYGDEPIQYEAAIDADGEILGTRIISHAETPGVGDVIESEEFKEQLSGLTFDDSISVGDDIEAVSGATVSTTSLVSSVRNKVDIAGEQFLGKEAETYDIDPSIVGSGTMIGVGSGFKGDIEVEVTVEDEKIQDIELVAHEDTPDLVEKAEEALSEEIVANQSLEVDTVSGATESSKGIIEAVHEAIN